MNARKKIEKTENIYLKHLLIELRKASNSQQVKIWNRVASDLSRPSRKLRHVNVSKLEKYSKEKETIIVPGKVLGSGKIKKSINVAAFNFSESATKKITQAKGTCLRISDLIKKSPKGNKIRILG